MKHQSTFTLATAAALGLLATVSLATAQIYKITDLGLDTTPHAISDFGHVAGTVSYPASGKTPATTRGFIWSNGVKTDLGLLPGGTFSNARSINKHGQVVGYADVKTSGNTWRAFVWDPSSGMHDLNSVAGPNEVTAASLGWVLHTARAINDAGQIVGDGVLNGDTSGSKAYLWELDANGNVKVQRVSLGTKEAEAETRGLNNAGQVVSSVPHTVVINSLGQTWDYPKASLWQRDASGIGYNVDLGLLDGRQSHAFSINNHGEVAGYAERAGGALNAFYWSDANADGVSNAGEMVSLGTLGGSGSSAFKINDARQVVGWAHDSAGARRAFVWDSTNSMRDLNKLSNVGTTWSLSIARAINNTGSVVGTGTVKVKNGTQSRGFLLTPVQ
jgi:probable HAF family extracellular repeat protein